MPAAVPETAAMSFLSNRNYIETTYGTGSFRRVREALLAGSWPEFPSVIVPNARYPTEMLIDLIDTARDVLGPEDFYERCGRGIVAYEMSVFMRFALRLTTPIGVLERATEAWRKVHSDGTWSWSGEEGAIMAILVGFPTKPGYCRFLSAYFKRLFELTGARDVKIEHPECSARGQRRCAYRATWHSK